MRSRLLFLVLLFPLAARSGEPLRCVETETAIEILAGEGLALRYNKRATAAAAESDPAYARTGYIHPLCTPSGRVVTGDYEPDHPHQHGLFFAWTKTSFEGRVPEFWNQKLETGRVGYSETIGIADDPDEAGFDVRHLHEDLSAPSGPVVALVEEWRLRLRAVEGGYLVDLAVLQKCAGSSPLRVERYHYGGMAIRGSSQWLGDEADGIATSEGLDRVAGNHTRPRWVRMAGELEGAPCGIAAYCLAESFRAPQWVRLHPSKPYFVFSPMVEEPFEITPEAPFSARYRFFVFDGVPDRDRIEAAGRRAAAR
jgi:hypothetical protein